MVFLVSRSALCPYDLFGLAGHTVKVCDSFDMNKWQLFWINKDD